MDKQNQPDLEIFENMLFDSFKTEEISESEYNKIKTESKSRILKTVLQDSSNRSVYYKLAFALSFTFLFFFTIFFASNQLSIKDQSAKIDKTISAIDATIQDIEYGESYLADIQTQLKEF